MAESCAAAVRACVTAALLLPSSFARPLPLELCFAAAQMAYAAALLCCFAAGACVGGLRGAWPGPPRYLQPVAPAQRALLRDFSLQAAWKLALAEGDKALLLLARQPQATGAFGLASALGALLVRLLLQPLEEAAYASFAAARAGRQHTARAALDAMLRLLALAGLFCAAVGPSFAHAALRCLYGAAWATAPGAASTLGAFAALIPLLALNGVLEAYTAAAMTASQVRRGNTTLLAAACAQAVVGISLRGMGPAALVAGNGAGMALRILAAAHFIAKGESTAALPGMQMLVATAPRARTAAVVAAAAAAAAVSDAALRRAPAFWPALGAHVAVGMAAAAATAATAATWEREALRGVAAAFKGRTTKKRRC